MNTKNAAGVIFGLAWLLLPPAGHAAPVVPPEPQAVGAWSSEMDGVQGRLLVAVDGKVNGTKMTRIYLELRNIDDLMSPRRVNFGSGGGLKMEVMDSKNKRLVVAGSDFDAIRPDDYEVVLPHDSSLRFLVSVPGYGVPKDAGTMLELDPSEGRILIPSQSRETYYLQGTFSVPASKTPGYTPEWHGILTLPPVKIPQ